MTSVALIDYGAGNLTSVKKALATLGATVVVPATPDDLRTCDGIIVPGVGHYRSTLALDESWRAAIQAEVRNQRPLLGICLGMQWLFEGSDEAPDAPGLGLLRGRCLHLGDERLSEGPQTFMKVPHVGWNVVAPSRPSWLLSGVAPGAQAYFTHSYVTPVGADVAAIIRASRPPRRHLRSVERHPSASSRVWTCGMERLSRA